MGKNKGRKILLLPGDGIGPEITSVTKRVLETLEIAFVEIKAEKEEIDKLAEMLKRSGKVRADMAEKFLAEIREK